VWVLSLGGAAVLVVALIAYVDHANQTANQPAPPISPAALREENQEAEIVVGQDQAPHVLSLKARQAPVGALRAAVVGYMNHQIALGTIDGPVTEASCVRAGASPQGGLAFRCSVEAASVNYPFLGVVDVGARSITYCKRDAPPVPSMNIPVSKRCT